MLDLPAAMASKICCRVHEDNAGALLLANAHKNAPLLVICETGCHRGDQM
jgi:hypothetical protein